MDNIIHHRLSLSIETLRFPLIVFIICLHCYTLTSTIAYEHTAYFRIIYPFSLWMGETGVPAYFFISGLLLFNSQKSYKQKLKSRLKTLLVPYLFFNSLVLLGFLCLMFMGQTIFILNKDLASYSLVDYIRAFWDRGSWSHGNGTPLLCPFWYIRNLIVLVVISPIIDYIIRNTKLLFPVVMGCLWINTHDGAFVFQSITMFSLGAFFPICNYNPIDIFEKYKPIFLCMFLLFATMDFLHLFVTVQFALLFHRFSLVANVFLMICFMGEFLYSHHYYSSFLSKSSFFVFCIHYPLSTCLRPVFVRFNDCSDVILAGLYFISVMGVTVLCVVIYRILICIMPKFINFVSGNRG